MLPIYTGTRWQPTHTWRGIVTWVQPKLPICYYLRSFQKKVKESKTCYPINGKCIRKRQRCWMNTWIHLSVLWIILLTLIYAYIYTLPSHNAKQHELYERSCEMEAHSCVRRYWLHSCWISNQLCINSNCFLDLFPSYFYFWKASLTFLFLNLWHCK